MTASINNRVEGESTTSPLTLSGYTPTAGSNQKLVVMAAARTSVGATSTRTATYDGNDMTLVRVFGTAGDTTSIVFELDGPTALAASGDIVITITSTDTLDGIKAQALTLLGVKLVTPSTANMAVERMTAASTVSDTLNAAGDNSVILSVLAVNGTGDAWTPASPLTTSASDTTGGDSSVFWADDILADGSGLTTIKWDDDAGTNSGSMAGVSFRAQGSGGDIKVAVVSGKPNVNASGTADFTKPGFGTPTACIVIGTRDDTDNTSVRAQSRASIGFNDFTNDFCIAHQDEDASAKVDCDAVKSNVSCYAQMDITGTLFGKGTGSTITDGVRLTNDSGSPVAPAVFHTIIMIGGADPIISLTRETINSSQNGEATRAHSGFTDGNDKLIFFVGTDISGEDSTNSGINNSFGVCHVTGNDAGGYTFVQRSIGWASDHNNSLGAPKSIISTDRVLDIITEAGTQDWGLEVTAFSSSGGTFTVTTRDNGAGAGMEVYSLALDLGDRSAKVGSVDSPTSGATFSITGMGFKPQYVGLGLTALKNEDTITTNDESSIHGISSVSGSGEETCHSWYNDSGSTNTDTANLFRSRALDLRDEDTVTVIQDHSFSSFDSGGVTLTINTENETIARKWGFWAIEEVAAAGLGPPEIITMLNRDKISPIRQM